MLFKREFENNIFIYYIFNIIDSTVFLINCLFFLINCSFFNIINFLLILIRCIVIKLINKIIVEQNNEISDNHKIYYIKKMNQQHKTSRQILF